MTLTCMGSKMGARLMSLYHALLYLLGSHSLFLCSSHEGCLFLEKVADGLCHVIPLVSLARIEKKMRILAS